MRDQAEVKSEKALAALEESLRTLPSNHSLVARNLRSFFEDHFIQGHCSSTTLRKLDEPVLAQHLEFFFLAQLAKLSSRSRTIDRRAFVQEGQVSQR
eukprot:scaffold34050_cov18-Tisochrysis_lutea.AAC.3